MKNFEDLFSPDDQPEEEIKKEKKLSPFDFVESIETKDYIYTDKLRPRDYNKHVINMAFAYHMDTIFFVNEINRYPNIPHRHHYDFLFYALPQKKHYTNWFKKNSPEELVEVVSNHYSVSMERAQNMISLLNENQLNLLRDFLDKGGSG